ncbi:MAG: hypothetical protein AAFX06_06730 [Planctomycetota bacterium]
MVPAEEHRSPDGSLHFAVIPMTDGDVAIGFREFGWHTHADTLASILNLPKPQAVRSYVDDVLNDRAVIAMQYIDGELRDIWISKDPAGDLKYCHPNERVDFRYWSGAILGP